MTNYKRDSRIKEEFFWLWHCGSILKFSLGCDNQESIDAVIKRIDSEIKSLVHDFSTKPLHKFERAVARMNIESGLSELLKNGESGHRLVLVLHAIAWELKLQGYKFEEYTEELLELLLTIENQQQMDDEEWATFQKSAEKRGKKILQKLQQLGYFICLEN